ncbi:CBS domain-containing protein [Pelagibacteraceae bacterium]|nr:CBS domain-containing protein [Pelagibacteraceae bacterium]
MNTNSADKTSSWKNWIIKKLISNDSTKEDILNFIANDEDDKTLEDLNDNNEKNLIKNIVNLNEKSVEDLMIPRSEIIALDHDKSYNEILEIIKEEGHSRFPVYKKNIDNVIGFFHIKDFIKSSQDTFQMSKIIRDVLYVAPKSPILDLLKTMRSSRIHIGLVVDGVGGVDGLVTIEDLVEEIVGEIEDEHDAEDGEELVYSKSDNSITVDASYRVEDLEEFFAIDIPRNENDETFSVGGLVYEKINRIPKNNEVIDFNEELRIKIVKSNNRKIEIVEVNKNN